MNSKERVRAAAAHKPVDRVPANFQCTGFVWKKLQKHYSCDGEGIYQKFNVDIREAYAKYIGPELESITDEDGMRLYETHWGFKMKEHMTEYGVNHIVDYYPLDEIETVEGLLNYNWPKAEWFDYSPITEMVEKHPDKAIMIGHPGPFQMAANLRNMEKLFMDMAINPEYAKTLYDKMVEFELEYYKRCFEAGKGKIDILRPHDDYGTQQSLLFSVDMWKQYFKENTTKLVDLAHSYGAFYQQHSCGAVAPIIPELIACGVDILEPLQVVEGLYPDQLVTKFDGQIAFHGGIDTQGILPFGTVDEVKEETKKYIQTLGKNSGYILMSSQSFEGDVPIENIEAVYSVARS